MYFQERALLLYLRKLKSCSPNQHNIIIKHLQCSPLNKINIRVKLSLHFKTFHAILLTLLLRIRHPTVYVSCTKYA